MSNVTLIDDPKSALKSHFGYDDFRSDQADIISKILEGKDVLAVMATGGGKSLCFQVPAICMKGTAIVVSPLISLMKDQVDALTSKGVSAGLLNSSLDAESSAKAINKLSSGQYKVFYVSPERLCTEDFKNLIKGIDVSFFAIDEAHCVSTWGHDFRIAFTKIKSVFTEVEQALGRRISKAAFTATATDLIRKDIIAQLDMDEPEVFVGSFDRPNIELHVRETNSKNAELIDIISQSEKEPTIIYTATVKAADAVYSMLSANGFSTGIYHGRLKPEVKTAMQDKFLNNEIQIIVATNAFGMGVDKPDVRKVIHYQMPGNIENYYQEAGRAGRDGKNSKAIMLFSARDRGLQEFFINMTFPSKDAIIAVQAAVAALCDGHPANLNTSLISQVAPDTVPENQIGSILRILESNGAIEIKNLDLEYDGNFAIEPLDINKEIDLDYLAVRRRVVASNLNAMERFCKTEMCRRTNILRYFDQEQNCSNCGTCDTCISREYHNAKINSIIPEETLKCVIATIDEHQGRYDEKMIHNILLGANSSTIKRKHLDKYEHFGALKSWAKSDMLQLIEKCISEKLVIRSNLNPLNLVVTSAGISVIDGSKPKSILAADVSKSLVSPSSIDNALSGTRVHSTHDVFDTILYEKLSKYRDFLAAKHNKPPFMIFTDKTLKLLATTVPSDAKDLELVGLSPNRINLFGENLITAISNHHAKKNSKKELNAESPDLIM